VTIKSIPCLWCLLATLGAVLPAGCGTSHEAKTGIWGPFQPERVLLTVDFTQDQTLRYKFISERKTTIDWDPNGPNSAESNERQTERLEMVVAYTPTAVDPYGVSTIRATCERVEAVRSVRDYGFDAAATAQGKSFVLKVDPRGRILDHASLRHLLQEMGNAAFARDTSRGRIKNPDMIGDFVASQWFLWDAEASIERPAEGVAKGQTWTSKLSVPTPMVMRKARDVTYRLEALRDTDRGRWAVIDSTYRLAGSVPQSWPIPYSGRFRVSGTFGFLAGYHVQSLEGTGRELFDIDAGRIEQSEQKYTMKMSASSLMRGIAVHPQITVEQTLTMELMHE
jgi:hypothetical protein